MAPTKDKLPAAGPAKSTTTPAPKTPVATPVTPVHHPPPVSNAERAARAARADAARRGIAEPAPLELKKTQLALGWDLFFGPYVEIRDITTPIVFELMGHPKLEPSPDIRDAVWPIAMVPVVVPVRFGNIAKGQLTVYKDDKGVLHTTVDGLLPFAHEAFPPAAPPDMLALAIRVINGDVTGELVLTPATPRPGGGFLPAIKQITEDNVGQVLGLDDLQDLACWLPQNTVGFGKFQFTVMLTKFLLDGQFPEADSPSFLNVQDESIWTHIAAKVEAYGIEKQEVVLERDEHAALSAATEFKVDLKPSHRVGDSWNGAVEATFTRGKFDIRGTLNYISPEGDIKGSATLLLTDMDSAWAAVKQRLGDKAPPAETHPGASGLALVGWGVLDFDLSEWLKGSVEVVVDPDGYITTLGRLEPTVTYELFKRHDLPKSMLPGAEMDFQIPIVGEILHVDGGFRFKAEGWYGGGSLFDITAEGVYSTNPQIPTELDISATLAVPAQATLTLEIWGGVGLGAGPISGGISLDLTGTATLSAYAEAKPHIARRKKRGATPTSIEYAISGHMDVAAALDVALKGSLELHVLTVKLASVDLGGHVWRIASFGVRVNFDHVIGSGTLPKVSFEDVPFRDYAFMSAAVHGKTREGDEQQENEKQEFENAPVRGELPAAHEPTPGPDITTPASPGAAAGQLPSVEDQPLPALTPGAAPPEEKTEFDMETVHHTLFLVFDDPPTVFMESPTREQLSKKLAVAVTELRRRQQAVRDGTAPPGEHSLRDLQDEERVANQLVRQCLRVELDAAKLGIHPAEKIPKRVPGFKELAREIHAYGEEFDRPDLVESAQAKAAPAYPARTRPSALAGKLTPRLDELEQKENGVTERYVREYQAYLVNEENYKDRQELLEYVEGRAARKLGRIIEQPMIERYEKKHGVSSKKVDFDVVDEVTGTVEVRVPDLYVEDFSVGDIKDVISQAYTEQMQDDALIAKGGTRVRRSGSSSSIPKRKKPLRFDLVVRRASHLRKRTHVTQPLLDAIDELNGEVYYWIPDPNVK